MKQALITGGSGGLGKITTEYLILRGWHVFSLDNVHPEEEKSTTPQITPVRADLTDDNSVKDALQMVSAKTDDLDAIIHLAGMLSLGSVVEIPSGKIERIMNVNLMGVYRINQAFLPMLRKRNGRIIITSSETGWQTPAPFNGPYSISKHALEAYADVLRRELNLLNIRVIKIQPGAIKTGLTKEVRERFSEALHSSELFKENISAAIHLINEVYTKAADPEIFVRIVYKALTMKKPKICYSVRPDRARSFLEWLPVSWADRIYRWVLTKKKT